MHVAAREGYYNCVKVLIDNGAEILNPDMVIDTFLNAESLGCFTMGR